MGISVEFPEHEQAFPPNWSELKHLPTLWNSDGFSIYSFLAVAPLLVVICLVESHLIYVQLSIQSKCSKGHPYKFLEIFPYLPPLFLALCPINYSFLSLSDSYMSPQFRKAAMFYLGPTSLHHCLSKK